jgi:hypothetical protein
MSHTLEIHLFGNGRELVETFLSLLLVSPSSAHNSFLILNSIFLGTVAGLGISARNIFFARMYASPLDPSSHQWHSAIYHAPLISFWVQRYNFVSP